MAVAVLVAASAAAALGAAADRTLDRFVVEGGVRLYAWMAHLGQQLPWALLLPVIALSVSFHTGSRLGHRVRRQPEARAIAAAQPPLTRYLILFAVAAAASLALAAMRAAAP